MKTIRYILPFALLAFSLSACRSDDPVTGERDKDELTLSAIVDNSSQEVGSRAIGDDFFVTGSNIDVTLTEKKSSGTQTNYAFTYTYGSDRIFKGNPGYYFTLDESYIESLTAKWPVQSIRNEGIKADQRLLADYKSADWMTGTVASPAAGGVIPAEAPVPLVFTRENVMLEFELVGQNTTGLNIESLLIEIQRAGENGSQAYWAYCGNPNGHAQLILEPGSKIFSSEDYLIGRIRITGQTSDYTIIFPETDMTLEAGKRYLVTLTPQGYFMAAYIYLHGFSEADEGIGIPFQQPTPDMDGNFVIETPLQLITMSYLVRNYNDGTSFVWSERTYVLSPDFVMTQQYADQYIPIPSALFTGEIFESDGTTPVTEIDYGSGTLQLFE